MAMTPAICDSCGAIFGSEGFIGGTGATNITITNSKVGPCPRCGGMGSIPDGVYDLQDDALKVIAASGTSPDTVQSLIGLLEALKRGEASSSQVIDRVERDAPALAPTVRNALSKSDPGTAVMLLIAILTLYLTATAAQPPSASEVAEAIREKPTPTYIVPAPDSEAKPASTAKPPAGSKVGAKKKRPPKTNGQSKQRKSRKRR